VAADEVLLIDTIGELSDWWGLSRVAFVGGSFGDRGGQNMIEPAGFGCAVCFGPHTQNFRDAVEILLSGKGAQVVEDEQALEQFVRRCAEDAAYADQLGSNAQRLVLAQRGAADRTVAQVRRLIRGPIVARESAAPPPIEART
jgi:3-deoxy-D-manno-octulosonic-acid transferase